MIIKAKEIYYNKESFLYINRIYFSYASVLTCKENVSSFTCDMEYLEALINKGYVKVVDSDILALFYLNYGDKINEEDSRN